MDAVVGFMRVALSCNLTYYATSPDLPNDSKKSWLGRWKQSLHRTHGLID